jgi:hypothetical protein
MPGQEPKLRFVFFTGNSIKSDGEVRVAVESYLDKKGILSFETHFADFSEKGIDTFRKAKILATFSQWKFKVPLNALRDYCVAKHMSVSISIERDVWAVSVMYAPTRTTAVSNGADLEVALTAAVTDVEMNLSRMEQQLQRVQRQSGIF